MRQGHPWNCWLLGWLLLVSSGALSQEAIFNVRHLSVEDGMSSRFITNVVQDKLGFIWIGTDYGVNRYDGKGFKTYDYTKNKLRASTRANLQIDLNGKVWVNNDQYQVDVLDPISEVVTPLEVLEPRLKGKSIKVRGRDAKDVIWGTADENILFTYDGQFHMVEPLPGNGWEMKSNFVFPSPWGTFLSIQNKALAELDNEGCLLNYYPMTEADFGSVTSTDSSVMLVKFQQLSGNQGFNAVFYEVKKSSPPKLIGLNNRKHPFSFTKLESNFAAVSANRDTEGRLWVSFLKRLMVFDKKGELIAEVPVGKDYWQDVQASNIFFDNQGQAWVRAKEGVYVVSLRQPNMRRLLHGSETSVSVRGMVKFSDDALLACTYNGLYLVNLEAGIYEKLIDKIYFGATCVGDSMIWLGVHSNGVNRFNIAHHKIEEVKISDKLKKSEEYLRPFEDKYTGQIYFGTRRQGMVAFDKHLQEIVPYTQLNQFTEFAKLEVLHILPTPTCIWACTSDGLYQLDRQKGIVARFNSFPSNFIYHLTIDENDVFWMATRGGGLVKWFKSSNVIRHYTTTDGLSHNIIYAAYDDGLGHLWLPSNYGLMSFEKSTGITVNYLPDDGTTDEEFNATAHYRAPDGTFYFGGLNGITAFHPSKIIAQRISQPLIVTGLKVLNGNALEDRLAQFLAQQQIVVGPDERFFNLEFALLDYRAKKLVYAWNLEGLDKNWTVQTENSIRLNALPYGKFTLKIKAQGAGNAWSENEMVIPIVVLAPFYLTWKFAVICVLVLGLFTYLFIRWRTAWLRREKERLTDLVEENTRELIRKNVELESLNKTKDRLFSIIAHDLRAPLVTLGGLARKVAFLIRQNRPDEVYQLGDSVETAVANVRNLVDNLLKWSILQDGNLRSNPELLQADELALEVIELYKGISEAKGVELVFNNIGSPVVWADRNCVSTVIRNLVDNAIKFTPAGGTVAVLAESNQSYTRIEVRDTGIGIAPEKLYRIFNQKDPKSEVGTNGEKGNGLGLVLCRELVEINLGTIEAKNNAAGGSAFIVKLPAKAQTAT
ncbi:MAG: ATP-binding protein [Saprospiraceae bacterium]|nr:ATP-binding protein [Saprospiraceae bacterium]